MKRGSPGWTCVMLDLERIAIVGMSEEDTDVCWALVHLERIAICSPFFWEDLWRWTWVNSIRMNQPFWVFLCLSDYLLPVCLNTPFRATTCCNKSRRLKSLHERKTLKSLHERLRSFIFYKCPNIYIYLEKNQIV